MHQTMLSLCHRFSMRVLFSAVAIGAAGCGALGLGDDTAAPCAPGGEYRAGCIGDGRRDTTPSDQPIRMCSKDEYTYFDVHMRFDVSLSAADRSVVDHCVLRVESSDGGLDYVLASETVDGTYYGCSAGHTPVDLGHVSYSSCGAPGTSLPFTFFAFTNTGDVFAKATETATCTRAPLPTGIVPVILLGKKGQ
jgi:hypothetical protein